ncbi:MAG: methyl-accepting chemotaxis protein [Clostridia bacterium]|nr:methyl-accepting chemotaxis protein [Clostridia bacterium]
MMENLKSKNKKNVGKMPNKQLEGIKGNNLTIKAKLIIFSLILSIIPIFLVGGYSYTYFQRAIKDQVGVLSEQLVKQNSAMLDGKMKEIEKSTVIVMSNKELTKILGKKEYENSYERFQDMSTIDDILGNIIVSNRDINSITIVRNNGEIQGSGENKELVKYIESGEFKNSDIYRQVKDSKKYEVHWVSGLLGGNNKVHVIRKIADYFNMEAGILVFEIDIKAIDKLYDDLGIFQNSRILIGDSNNKAIYQYVSHENSDKNGQAGEKLSSSPYESYFQSIPIDREYGTFISNQNLLAYSTCHNGWRLLSITPLNQLMSEVYKVGTMTIIIAIICLIVSIMLSLYITFNITNPLKKIMELMNRVEKGDLTVKSELVGNNEIVKLSKGFNNMIDSMRKLIKDTNRTFKSVKVSTKSVDEIAEQYTMVSEQVAISMGEIANGSTEQAKNAEDATLIMGQLSSRIDNMVDSINVVKEATDKTKEISGNATDTVKNLYEKTEEYAKISSGTKETISKLKDSVSQIINIVDLIKNISEQTNLLALNAAIEAARSGEAGKGFAVVADEIRKLAEQSKEATSQITDLANDINTDVTRTVESVEEGDKLFGEQYYAVFDTDTAFKNITESIESIISEVEDVNNAVEDIEQYKNKTIDSVGNIAAVTEEAAAGTQEVMASTQEQSSSSQQLSEISKELISLVDRLNESIEKFKVNNGDLI